MKLLEKTVVLDVLELENYTPSMQVNAAMSQLVEAVIAGEIDIKTLDTPTIQKVQAICAATESALEAFWATAIEGSELPKQTLQAFPYLDNYSELVRRELSLVAASGLALASTHSALVIGSGPLPLTAHQIYLQAGSSVDQVDPSSTAVTLGQRVCTALAMPTDYYKSTGQTVVPTKQYDLIVIAALAGQNTRDKQAIVDNLLPYLSNEGRMIIRSARAERELLYPVVPPDDIKGVRLLRQYHPDDDIINSVLIYGK